MIASFAAAANRKSRSATVLYSDQWPSGGGGSSPRFSLSRGLSEQRRSPADGRHVLSQAAAYAARARHSANAAERLCL